MAKYRGNNINTGKNTVIRQISNSLDKHGRIKGRNKKETRILTNGCTHHKVTKNGKVKATTEVDPGAECTCYMCTHRFSAIPYRKDEQKQILKDEMAFLDHDIFILQEYGADEHDIKQVSQAKIMLSDIHHKYKKVLKVAKRMDSTNKGGGKGKGKKELSSSEMGGWK